MAKTKGTTFNLDSALVGRKVSNSAGFNSAASRLGSDTVPGPIVGGPLMNSRAVDDNEAKLTRYPTGVNPFGLSADAAGVLGPNVVRQNAGRTPDNPVPDNAQLPDLAVRTKPDEIEHADPNQGLGERPRGVMDR